MSARLRESHPFRSVETRDRYLAHYDARASAWPVPSEARMVPTDHGDTLVRVSGPVEGPPLVLLPGAWAHSLMWPPEMIGSFSETYRTYSVDNIVDFGRSVSTRPVERPADFMAWLDQLFGALALSGGVNLMGMSRGAWLAAEYTVHAPTRLAKVVWLSPGLTVIGPDPRSATGGPLSLAALMVPSSRTVGAMMRWLMPEAPAHDGPAFAQYVDDTALGLKCFDPRLVGRTTGPRVFTDAELAGIEVPVFYMAGADERLSSVRSAVSRLSTVAPRIRTTVVPGVGHGLITVQPETVGTTVRQFLDGMSASTERALPAGCGSGTLTSRARPAGERHHVRQYPSTQTGPIRAGSIGETRD
jgi:pimeloyl-ACP methyl ester carboxylesterase